MGIKKSSRWYPIDQIPIYSHKFGQWIAKQIENTWGATKTITDHTLYVGILTNNQILRQIKFLSIENPCKLALGIPTLSLRFLNSNLIPLLLWMTILTSFDVIMWSLDKTTNLVQAVFHYLETFVCCVAINKTFFSG